MKNSIYTPPIPLPIIKAHLELWHGQKDYILQKITSGEDDAYVEFEEMLQSCFDELKDNIILGKIDEFWTEIYGEGDYHSPRNNVDSRWSGLFYANYDPVVHKPNLFHIKNPIEYTELVEGDVLIFPGPLYQEVLKCESDVERITIHFNTK